MTSHIEFLSNKAADKGLALLRKMDPNDKQWNHDKVPMWGALKFYVTEKEKAMLKRHKIAFMLLHFINDD